MAADFPMKSTDSNGWFNATATESTESTLSHAMIQYQGIWMYPMISDHDLSTIP